MQDFMTNIGLPISYVLTVVACLGAFLLPLYKAIVDDPKSLMKSLMGVGVLAVLFGVSWAISGSEVTPIFQSFGITESGSKAIGGGIIMTYIMSVGAILAIVYSTITSFLK